MVKAPRAGRVKTRLVPPLSDDEAAALAACLARDAVSCARRAARDVLIAYDPPDARAALEGIMPAGLHWAEQRGADLGARLDAVSAEAESRGFGPVVILGADSPTLPAAFVRAALDALTRGDADVALGPTDDGGYYLVGVRSPTACLFHGVAWSTPEAFRQTASNAARLGLRLFQPPRWYDVDTPADLTRLRQELSTDERARRRAPHTHAWLLAHAE